MFPFEVKIRQVPNRWGTCLIFMAAIILSLGVGAILLAFQGKPPVRGILLLFKGAFGSRWALEDCIVKAIPIFLCSLGVSIAFRLQIWNIGAEGQFALGTVGATFMALSFPDLPKIVLLPAMLAGAMIAGGLWGFIPAFLKIRFRTNEIIVTLMLNYIGILFLDYLVYGPWKDPVSFGFPVTKEFSPGAVIGMIGGTRINWGILLCFLFAVLIWVFFRYSRLGYELKASGENPRAARYAGLPFNGLVILVMVAGGAVVPVAMGVHVCVGALVPVVVGLGDPVAEGTPVASAVDVGSTVGVLVTLGSAVDVPVAVAAGVQVCVAMAGNGAR